ncbi:MAG: TRAP transporter large permease subunit [Anaerofustis sp.]
MMLVAIAFSSCIGLVVLPFQIGVVASFGYLSSASNGLFGAYDYLHFLIFSLIFGTAVMAIYFLLCKFIYRPDMSKLKAEVEIGKKEPFNTKQKLAIWAMVVMIIVTIVPSFLPATSAIRVFMNSIGTSAFVLLICAGITLFRDKTGKSYYTFQELANNGLYWGVMFMVSTAVVIETALSVGDTGFSATFINLFTPLLGGTSPYIFALLICIVTIILTNLINNAVAGAIMVPLMYSFSTVIGANPMMLVALIVFVSDVGLILPCSSPTGALLAGNKDWLNAKDIFFQSLIGILATIIAVAIIGIPLGNLVFS